MAGLVLFILALAAAIYLGAARYIPSFEPVPLSAGLESSDSGISPAAAAAPLGREVFPYSVIDGGAVNVEELKDAMARDPVVAAHYAGFAIDRTHVDRLTQPRLAHVSYRIGHSVFWTRNPIALKAGEQILTDGVHVARTRCGNQLADAPGETSPLEPAPGTMDVPFRTAMLGSGPLALLRAPSALPTGLGAALGSGTTADAPAGAGGVGSGSGFWPGGAFLPGAGFGQTGTSGDTPVDGPADDSGPPSDTATGPAHNGPDPNQPGGPGHSDSPPGPAFPPTGPGLPTIPAFPPGTGEWPPLPPGGPDAGGGTPVIPPNPPVDPGQDPVSVPEPGMTLLLAGGVAYALRRVRAARH